MSEQSTQTIQEQKQAGNNSFAEWCLIELFGHQQIAGFVTEATIGGCSFLRVDVPKREGEEEGVMYTRLFGNGAIYAINITTEAEARAAVERLHPKPYVARVRESQMLNPASDDDDDDYAPSGYESRITGDEYDDF